VQRPCRDGAGAGLVREDDGYAGPVVSACQARLPILWLFFGPPVIRLAERGAEASLEGSIDVWNLVRIGWWVVFGAFALLDLYRSREHVAPFLRGLGTLPAWTALWLATLLVSASYSPSPAFTAVHALMMGVLVVAALDMGVKLYTGAVRIGATLQRWLLVSLALLGVTCVVWILAPDVVMGRQTLAIPRVRGGSVADVALLAQVLFFVGYHLAFVSRQRRTGLYLTAIVASPLFLLLAQTRAMYVSFFVAVLALVLGSVSAFGRSHRNLLFSSACFVLAAILALGLYESFVPTPRGPLAQAEAFLVREAASIQNLNSRVGLTSFLLDRVAGSPWGLGFSAGPRQALLSSPLELRQYGIFEAFAGNAHSMYLEVFAGSGYLGLLSFLAVLLLVGWRLVRAPRRDALPIGALFLVVLVGGITESYGVLPFAQSSALLWIVIAFASALGRGAGAPPGDAAAIPTADVVHHVAGARR
jgi:O-antigen ligase